MGTDPDTRNILDRLDTASDYQTELVLTGSQARTLNNYVFELNEIRGEVGDLRDRLAKADMDLRWERTLRERVEAQLRQSSADNLAMIRAREEIRAIVTGRNAQTIGTEAAGMAIGRDSVCREVLTALNRKEQT